MTALPSLSTGQLRALKIAAAHTPRTPASERVERDPHGKQYVAELEELGLLARCTWHGRGIRRSLEVTPLAVAVLRSYWTGERMTEPGVAKPPPRG